MISNRDYHRERLVPAVAHWLHAQESTTATYFNQLAHLRREAEVRYTTDVMFHAKVRALTEVVLDVVLGDEPPRASPIHHWAVVALDGAEKTHPAPFHWRAGTDAVRAILAQIHPPVGFWKLTFPQDPRPGRSFSWLDISGFIVDHSNVLELHDAVGHTVATMLTP